MLITIRTIEKEKKMIGKKVAAALLVMNIDGVFAQTIFYRNNIANSKNGELA